MVQNGLPFFAIVFLIGNSTKSALILCPSMQPHNRSQYRVTPIMYLALLAGHSSFQAGNIVYLNGEKFVESRE